MTTPRFLILPGLIVNVDQLVSIEEIKGEDDGHCVQIRVHNDMRPVYSTCSMEYVQSALREAMKGPELPQMSPHVPFVDDLAKERQERQAKMLEKFCRRTPHFPTDIAGQASETREAGGGQ